MWVMLCVSVLVAVWEILTRPFSGVLEAIRKFFWQLDYEMKAKDKSSQDREAWLEEQLKQEREQKAAAEAPKQEGNDGN
nr:hypothetical protein BaRGS_011582 [Batillaria attramentaria]